MAAKADKIDARSPPRSPGAISYTQVYAGDSPDSPGRGVMLVVRRAGAANTLTPGAAATTTFVRAPGAGGSLRILRVENGALVVANAAGREFRFNPVSAAFD
jgi:hypothetical protein